MNKKFFNLLLMGALTVTTIGSVSSCKDYDDDINGLQEQINKLATASDLEAKVSELKGLISTNSSNISSLQTAVAKATTLDEVKAYIASCDFADKKYVTDAIKTLEDGDIADIKSTLQKVQDQLKKDGESLDDLDERLTAAEKTLKTLNETTHPNDMTAVNKKVTTIENDLAAVNKKVSAIEDELKDIIGEYTTMVTDVDLYTTSASRYWSNGLPDKNLLFVRVASEQTTKFPADANVANSQIEFSAEKKNVTTTDSLVIRVSPTNAELTTSNISLINSQGKELTGLVDVQSVKRYNKLITGATRAAADGNGLWTVTFKLKDGVNLSEFEAATLSSNNYIQFAVAVKNTASSDTRRVISAYDVTAKGSSYEPANNGFIAQGNDGKWRDIRDLRNRFYYSGTNNYGAFSYETYEQKTGVKELAWADNTPYTAENAATHVDLDEYDVRCYQTLLPVTLGQKINICVGATVSGNNTPSYYSTATGRGYVIKGFYVTLDTDFAIESAPSELNAWAKYSYENVGVTTSTGKIAQKATMIYGNEGYITINALDDTNVKGDIIGFRVYAVNLDGTLVDPDGRAFYVKVGETKDAQSAEANATIADKKHFTSDATTSNYYADFTVSDSFNFNIDDAQLSTLTWKVNKYNNPGDLGNNTILPTTSDFAVAYLDKDGHDASSAISKIKTMRVYLLHPQMFVDGGTYTLNATLSDATHEVRDFTVQFTKVMPTADDVITLNYVDEGLVATNIFSNTDVNNSDIYKITVGDVVKSKELGDYLTDLSDQYYALWFSDLEVEMKNIQYSTPWGVSYKYVIDKKNIDGKAHDINYAYDFGKISLTHNYVTGGWNEPNDYWKTSTDTKIMNFKTWLDFSTLAWATPAASNNVITWNAGGSYETQKITTDKIIMTNTLLGRFNNTTGSPVTLKSLTAYALIKDVKFSNAAFSVKLYYSESGSTDNTILFDQVTGTTLTTTTGDLTLTLADCFGHTVDFTLPVTIKRY